MEMSMYMTEIQDARLRVTEGLATIAAWEADRVRQMVDAAVLTGDAESIRKEGYHWSGRIGVDLLALAD